MKRVFDVIASSLGLAALSPVLAFLAIWIKVNSRGPVFYRGVRVGLGGKPFQMMKFRTMIVGAGNLGASSTPKDDPRITRAGHFLRKYKLDELPQLINVFKGDMSFVGPRPEVQRFVDMYTEEEQVLLAIRPGITDWASLWNSNEGELLAGSSDPDRDYLEKIRPEKIRLQLKYARERSFWVDIVILVRTLATVVGR